MGRKLPTVVVSSVIRSAHRGNSHGGVYLVDLENDAYEQVLDWDDCGIDFRGRGVIAGYVESPSIMIRSLLLQAMRYSSSTPTSTRLTQYPAPISCMRMRYTWATMASG